MNYFDKHPLKNAKMKLVLQLVVFPFEMVGRLESVQMVWDIQVNLNFAIFVAKEKPHRSKRDFYSGLCELFNRVAGMLWNFKLKLHY